MRHLFNILPYCFAILYVGALILLIRGRIEILSLCSFSCVLSVGGECFFWFKYFILCLSMILLYCSNVSCIRFWYFSIESFGRASKWLTGRNAWPFSTCVSVLTTTVILLLSVWTSIALSVTSSCFICFMTQSCLLCSML